MSQLVEWAMFLLNTCLITLTIVVLALLLAAFCRRQVVWKHHVLSCGLVLIAITPLLVWRFPVSYLASDWVLATAGESQGESRPASWPGFSAEVVTDFPDEDLPSWENSLSSANDIQNRLNGSDRSYCVAMLGGRRLIIRRLEVRSTGFWAVG